MKSWYKCKKTCWLALLVFIHSGALSRIPLRPVLIWVWLVCNSHCKRKKTLELKGIIIAPQHVPTWQVVCDFDTSIASEFCDEAASIVFRMLKPGKGLQKIENKFINEIKMLLA